MNYKLIITAVSAFALGLAVQGLHAQMTPPAYVVAMNDVKDEAGYKNEFLPPVLKAITDHGRWRFQQDHDTERRTAAEPCRHRSIRKHGQGESLVGQRQSKSGDKDR